MLTILSLSGCAIGFNKNGFYCTEGPVSDQTQSCFGQSTPSPIPAELLGVWASGETFYDDKDPQIEMYFFADGSGAFSTFTPAHRNELESRAPASTGGHPPGIVFGLPFHAKLDGNVLTLQLNYPNGLQVPASAPHTVSCHLKTGALACEGLMDGLKVLKHRSSSVPPEIIKF